MASCVTPVVSEMSVRTDTPRVKIHRKNILRLMIAEHPESCVVCSKGNRCQLRQLAAQLGIGETHLYPMPNYKTLEQANPFIIRDLSKCVLCGKCIRADHELVVVGAIDYNLRGFKSRPSTIHDRGLEHSSCTFCGTCLSMCPTGALSPNNPGYTATPERESFSICGFCGVGCGLAMGYTNSRIVEVNPANRPDTVNRATLCVRGHFAHDFLNTHERLLQPMIRQHTGSDENTMAPASWDAAIDVVAGRLLEIKSKNGSQSVAFLGSSKCTNEENYLFQKIARALLKTNNVDNGSYLSGRHVINLLEKRTNGLSRLSPLDWLEKAQAVFVLGADPGHSTPVVSYYLKRASKKGVPLVVADSIRTDLAAFSSAWLDVSTQSDFEGSYIELLNGLAALLYEKKAHDAHYIKQFTEGFKQYSDDLSTLDREQVSLATGIDVGVLNATAELLKGKKIAFVIGSGILQQRFGMQTMEAVINLSLMTGSLGSEGAGIHILAKENNQVGAQDMGAVPDALPGRQPLYNDSDRNRWEQFWQTEISPQSGLNMIQMIEAAEKGNLKGLYILGENPLRSLPQPDRVRKALAKLDFIVVQDILNTETVQIADVVLPGAAFSEKGGSFTNMEGRIQSFDPVVPPPGDAHPDWEILGSLAAKLGDPNQYASLGHIRDEIRIRVPMYKALDRHNHTAWVAVGDHRQSDKDTKKTKTMVSFSPVVPGDIDIGDELSTTDYPFTAIMVSVRYHCGSGTRTGCSDRILKLGLRGEIELSPQDGETLSIRDGDTVRVVSSSGAIKRQVRFNKRLRQGTISIPLAFNGNDAMNLLAMTQPDMPDSPGWKTCRVKLEKI
ncbi:MAG: molybdopterin-dependent oxidoreductase [Desulfobacterales bacterium]|nr:MAG: molybdopterin-dependent oxidoreductase [Desulfobacterales bacterium]